MVRLRLLLLCLCDCFDVSIWYNYVNCSNEKGTSNNHLLFNMSSYLFFFLAVVVVLFSKNQDALRETVQNTGTALIVGERGEVLELPTQRLVPGDIIEIPSSGCTMQCDAVLLSGNCILDEAMLTGNDEIFGVFLLLLLDLLQILSMDSFVCCYLPPQVKVYRLRKRHCHRNEM